MTPKPATPSAAPFTPGPWKVGELRHAGDYLLVETTQPGNRGCIVCDVRLPLKDEHNHHPERQEANARLIAAAPELVEALKMALSAHGRTVEQAWDDVPLDPWEETARAVLAKIEKAT